MAPPTRTTRSRTQASTVDTTPPNPPTKGRGKKRKTPNNDEDDAAEAQESVSAPATAPPKPNSKSTTSDPNASTAASPPTNQPANTLADESTGSEDPRANTGTNSNGNVDRQPSDASTSGQVSSSTSSALANLNAQELAARAEALEKEVRNLKKYKVMWAKHQQGGPSREASLPVPDSSIPRPPGERGKNGWNMQTALQLKEDGDMYNAILATTRDAVQQAGLDYQIKFDEQDPTRVGVCYSQMKHSHPYLKRFKSDWACRELVIGTLQNRRKVENAKNKPASDKDQSKTSTKSKRSGHKPRSAKPKDKTDTINSTEQGEEEGSGTQAE